MKNIWIWIVIAAIVIGGLWFMNRSDDGAPPAETETETASDTEMVGDIRGAFTGAGSVRCGYTDSENGATGEAFVKSGNVRVNTTMPDGKVAHVIYKGDTSYVWIEGETQGFTFTTAELQGMGAQATVSTRAEFQQTLEGQSSGCKAASVADSEFTPPTSVEFVSLSSFGK